MAKRVEIAVVVVCVVLVARVHGTQPLDNAAPFATQDLHVGEAAEAHKSSMADLLAAADEAANAADEASKAYSELPSTAAKQRAEAKKQAEIKAAAAKKAYLRAQEAVQRDEDTVHTKVAPVAAKPQATSQHKAQTITQKAQPKKLQSTASEPAKHSSSIGAWKDRVNQVETDERSLEKKLRDATKQEDKLYKSLRTETELRKADERFAGEENERLRNRIQKLEEENVRDSKDGAAKAILEKAETVELDEAKKVEEVNKNKAKQQKEELVAWQKVKAQEKRHEKEKELAGKAAAKAEEATKAMAAAKEAAAAAKKADEAAKKAAGPTSARLITLDPDNSEFAKPGGATAKSTKSMTVDKKAVEQKPEEEKKTMQKPVGQNKKHTHEGDMIVIPGTKKTK